MLDDASEDWDGLVTATEFSDVTQLSAWARLRGAAGYSPTYLLAWQGDELVGGAQILSRRIPLIGNVGYLSCGPLLASDESRAELRAALCTALADCAARMTALFVQPPAGAEDISTELLRRGFRLSEAEIAPVASLRLDLGVGEDQLRAGLNRTLRRRTRQWPSRGVTVRAGDERDVEAFAELTAETAAYQGYEPLSADYLLGYFRELAPGGFVKLFVGEVAARPVAARMYTVCGNVMTLRLVGMTRSSDAAPLSVPAAVEWHAILWAKSHGVRWFDSGGIRKSSADLLMSGQSPGPADLTGPDRFKASFGGRAYTYPPAAEHVSSPIVRMGYDVVRRSGRAEDALQLIRRQIRGGTRSAWPPGARRAGVARTSSTFASIRHRAASFTRGVFDTTIKPPYVRVRRWVTTLLFERRYGVETDGRVPLSVLGIDDEHRVEYLPSGWLTLRRVLPRRTVGPDDVFIDIGSGKGRAVLVAATYPFRRVIGVELSQALTEAARANLDRNRDRLACKDVQLVCADALTYEIPDEVTVVFLYNPFTGPVFERVVEKLIASVDRSPRTLRLVYANPVEEAALRRTGRVHLVKTTTGMRPTKAWARSNAVWLYAITPRRRP